MFSLLVRFSFLSLLLCSACLNISAVGVIDRTFGTRGTVTTSVGTNTVAKKVKFQNDGKIIVLGEIGNVGAIVTFVARYNPDGSLDSGFGTNGIVTHDFSTSTETMEDLALQVDGKIVVAGSIFSTESQSIDFVVARLNANGSLDSAFGTNGMKTVNQSSVDELRTVLIQPDGKIFAAGRTSQNSYDFAALRLNPDGSLDSGFGSGGLLFHDLGPFTSQQVFLSADLMTNGRIVVGGTAALSNDGVDVLIVLEPNGSFALDFGVNGVLQQVNSTFNPSPNMNIKVLPDGKILTLSRFQFRRLLSNGAPDSSFRNRSFPSGSIDNGGSNFIVRPDGRIFVFGQGAFLVSAAVSYFVDGREIGRVLNLGGRDVTVQSDNRFLTLNSSANSLSLTRYHSISSSASRMVDIDFDGRADFLIVVGGNRVLVDSTSRGMGLFPIVRNAGETFRVIAEDFYSSNPDLWQLFYFRSGSSGSSGFFDRVEPIGLQQTYQWGISGDLAVGGDYDGEPIISNASLSRRPSELTVFRPSTGDWWVYNRLTNTYFVYHWGAVGDKPVPADYDYDGITDFAVYRPSTGTWWIHRSSNDSYFTINFGIASDIPLTGDFDGDGRADFTVYRASEGNWYQFLTTDGFRVVRFGLPTDYPVPGDYDGDGKHDIAVFRDGVWYILQSSFDLRIVLLGSAGDVPVTVRYD